MLCNLHFIKSSGFTDTGSPGLFQQRWKIIYILNVSAVFFSFLKIQNNSPPFLCSRAETVSKLTGDGLEGFRATFLDFNQCSTKRQLEKHKLLKVSVMAFTHSEIGGKTFLIKAFKLLLSFSLKASAELLNNLLKTCTKSHSSIDHTADDDYF